jgi:hypothetical protein
MRNAYPDLVPTISKIDLEGKKIYLKIDGPDFWELAGCDQNNFDKVLPDWQEQMIEIIKAHKSLGIFKYSMHPSSYFVVNGQLKSINYFFCYKGYEPQISIKDVESHIHTNRKAELKKYIESLGVLWDRPQPFELLETLCWESFRNSYPESFIEEVKRCLK